MTKTVTEAAEVSPEAREVIENIGGAEGDRTLDLETGSLVHPREVFKPAILSNAAALIVAHNHPSGDPTPSPEDRDLTRRLVNAGKLPGIPLLDHIITGENGSVSPADRGDLEIMHRHMQGEHHRTRATGLLTSDNRSLETLPRQYGTTSESGKTWELWDETNRLRLVTRIRANRVLGVMPSQEDAR